MAACKSRRVYAIRRYGHAPERLNGTQQPGLFRRHDRETIAGRHWEMSEMIALAVAAAASAGLAGVWATGDAPAACATAEITAFLDDGVYLSWDRAGGALHAVGRWRLEDERLVLTHSHAPFPASGAVRPERSITVVRLDATTLVTAGGPAGSLTRTRCPDLSPGSPTAAAAQAR